MELNKNNSGKLFKIKEKIKKYKDSLIELKEKLKKSEKNEEIIKSLESNNDNKIYYNFFFFQNYKKYICLDVSNNIDNTHLFKYFYHIKENTNNRGIYDIIIQWIYFLYMELIDNIYYTELKKNTKKINQIKVLLEQTLDIIIILYNTSYSFLSIKSVFDILYFLLFLIENNFYIKLSSGNFDKLYKTKNYILFGIFFSFLGNVSYSILNKANIISKKEEEINNENYEKEIKLFFEMIKSLEENKEINFPINKSIILNNNLLSNLFQ